MLTKTRHALMTHAIFVFALQSEFQSEALTLGTSHYTVVPSSLFLRVQGTLVVHSTTECSLQNGRKSPQCYGTRLVEFNPSNLR